MDSDYHDGRLAHTEQFTNDLDHDLLREFINAVETAGIELHSLMLHQHGRVVAETWWWPYSSTRLHFMHSATKSFTATGVGMAIGEGRFSLQDKVVNFFPGAIQAGATDFAAEMTVEHLLTQTSGIPYSVSGSTWRRIESSWVDEFFKLPVQYKPGTAFMYSSATSYMLSAIVTATTGESLASYIDKRLFSKIGANSFRWDMGPEGINPGGNGLICKTEDLLKLAVLHLQRGVWGDIQLVSEEWVEAATSPKFGNSYGYHWWMGPHGREYYANGAFGQCAFVFPDHNAVVTTTGADDMYATHLTPLVWTYFPQILTSNAGAIANGSNGRSSIRRLLQPVQESHSVTAEFVSRKIYVMTPNDDGINSLEFEFGDETCVMTVRDQSGGHRIDVGLRDWKESSTTLPGAFLHHGYDPPEGMKVFASGVWRDATTFVMTWQFVESPFRDTVVIHFDRLFVSMDRGVNVNSSTTMRPTIWGSANS